MKNFRLRAPSPALLISVIALFVALGGTTYAAVTAVPVNSVGTKQIKNLAVTSPKLADGAVTAGKIDTTGLTVPNADAVGGVTVDDLKRLISERPGAIEMGNVVLTGIGCEVAAPNGLSATGPCITGSYEPFYLMLPVNLRLRNLRAEIPAALDDPVSVAIATINGGSTVFDQIFCTIPAGSTFCTDAGPSFALSAGTPIVFAATTLAHTRLLFSYELAPA